MKREERNEMIDHRGNEIEQCLQTIEFLSESTEDYLFLWDFQTGNLHFSNPVYEKLDYGCTLFSQESGNQLCRASQFLH